LAQLYKTNAWGAILPADAYHGRVAAPEFAAWHLDLIAELRVARLATVTNRGEPRLVPVCYALVEGEFSIPVDEKPKRAGELARVANIRANPAVSLLFDRYDDDWTRLAWVRVDGTATVAATGGSSPEALAALRARYGQYREMALESLPLIRIVPSRVTGWRWSDGPAATGC